MSKKFNFTKKEFDNFRKDYAEAVKQLESKYGLEIVVKNITYDVSEGFHFKTSCNLAMNEEEKEKKEKEKFVKLCRMYGLKETDYRRTVKYNNNWYTIKSIVPTRRKYPIAVIETGSGKEYMFAVETIKMLIDSK